ncbi:DUF5818 domain-containing protein [Sphingomonas sp.]|uniref:DUF5818 domain-containing protein n=1 Tax=Sphingomonas sp. TaxID=28214 RepID=UPI000DB52336|nr:DUF5818 domain-containing protein [Sphingomonas sp.]PZU06305.1 MAG: hypothetical protein DI605_19280 [Sphingomonas sp.]
MSEGRVPLRLRGVLRLSDRGPLLEIDDGPVWRLQTEDDVSRLQDLPVKVEAWQRGASVLELLWIGPL